MANFDKYEFGRQFEAFIKERGALGKEEDAEKYDGELVSEEVGVEGSQVLHMASAVFLDVFIDRDDEVHRYWSKYFSNFPKDA